jgi:hypothetical protein
MEAANTTTPPIDLGLPSKRPKMSPGSDGENGKTEETTTQAENKENENNV